VCLPQQVAYFRNKFLVVVVIYIYSFIEKLSLTDKPQFKVNMLDVRLI